MAGSSITGTAYGSQEAARSTEARQLTGTDAAPWRQHVGLGTLEELQRRLRWREELDRTWPGEWRGLEHRNLRRLMTDVELGRNPEKYKNYGHRKLGERVAASTPFINLALQVPQGVKSRPFTDPWITPHRMCYRLEDVRRPRMVCEQRLEGKLCVMGCAEV